MRNDTIVRFTLAVAIAAGLHCGNDRLEQPEPFDFHEPPPAPAEDTGRPDLPRDVGPPEPPAPSCDGSVIRIESDELDFSVLEPNLYVLLDTSGSMGEWENCQDSEETGCCDDCLTQECCSRSCCDRRTRPYPIDEAKRALDTIADSLASDVRFGVGTFPSPSTPGLISCGMQERLSMGDHGSAEIKRSYANLEPEGSTPTGASLFMLHDQRSLSDPDDPDDARRARAAILITDGEPTSCEEAFPSVEEATALAEQGTLVYVVGFRSAAEEATLDAIAEAGGTNNVNAPDRRFYVADDTSELVTALGEISDEILGCRRVLESPPAAGDDVRLVIDGETVDADAYTYAAGSGTLRLSRPVCEQLQEQPATIVLWVGCRD